MLVQRRTQAGSGGIVLAVAGAQKPLAALAARHELAGHGQAIGMQAGGLEVCMKLCTARTQRRRRGQGRVGRPQGIAPATHAIALFGLSVPGRQFVVLERPLSWQVGIASKRRKGQARPEIIGKETLHRHAEERTAPSAAGAHQGHETTLAVCDLLAAAPRTAK